MQNNKRLYRSESNKMIAGVCGGLADFFGFDATLVRLVFVIMALLGGHGLLVYLILWIITPKEQSIPATTLPTSPQ